MLDSRKVDVLLQWLSCFNIKIGKLSELEDGLQLLKLLSSIEPECAAENVAPDEAFVQIEQILISFHGSLPAGFLSLAAKSGCRDGTLAVAAALALSTLVLHATRSGEANDVAPLLALDEAAQSFIKDMVQIVSARDNVLGNLRRYLRAKPEVNSSHGVSSPTHTSKSSSFTFSPSGAESPPKPSPLKTPQRRPLLPSQLKELHLLREQICDEERTCTELRAEVSRLKKALRGKDKQIQVQNNNLAILQAASSDDANSLERQRKRIEHLEGQIKLLSQQIVSMQRVQADYDDLIRQNATLENENKKLAMLVEDREALEERLAAAVSDRLELHAQLSSSEEVRASLAAELESLRECCASREVRVPFLDSPQTPRTPTERRVSCFQELHLVELEEANARLKRELDEKTAQHQVETGALSATITQLEETRARLEAEVSQLTSECERLQRCVEDDAAEKGRLEDHLQQATERLCELEQKFIDEAGFSECLPTETAAMKSDVEIAKLEKDQVSVEDLTTQNPASRESIKETKINKQVAAVKKDAVEVVSANARSLEERGQVLKHADDSQDSLGKPCEVELQSNELQLTDDLKQIDALKHEITILRQAIVRIDLEKQFLHWSLMTVENASHELRETRQTGEGDAGHVFEASCCESELAVLSDAKQELSDVKQELSDTKQELSDTKRELWDVEEELSDITQELSDVNQELSGTNRELLDTNKELADAKKELSDMKQELSDTNQELSDTNRELLDLNQELSDAKQELSNTKQELSDTKQELVDMKQKLSDANQELSDMKQQLSDTSKGLSNASEGLSDAKEELSHAHNCSNLAGHVEEPEDKAALLETEKGLKVEVNKLRVEVNELKTQLANATERLREAEASIKALRASNKLLEKQGDQLVLEAANKRVFELEKQRLQERIQELVGMVADSRATAASQIREHEESRKQLELGSAEREKKLGEVVAKCDNLGRTCKILENKNAGLKLELEALRTKARRNAQAASNAAAVEARHEKEINAWKEKLQYERALRSRREDLLTQHAEEMARKVEQCNRDAAALRSQLAEKNSELATVAVERSRLAAENRTLLAQVSYCDAKLRDSLEGKSRRAGGASLYSTPSLDSLWSQRPPDTRQSSLASMASEYFKAPSSRLSGASLCGERVSSSGTTANIASSLPAGFCGKYLGERHFSHRDEQDEEIFNLSLDSVGAADEDPLSRYSELHRRNSMVPLHLKSCYPIEMQDRHLPPSALTAEAGFSFPEVSAAATELMQRGINIPGSSTVGEKGSSNKHWKASMTVTPARKNKPRKKVPTPASVKKLLRRTFKK